MKKNLIVLPVVLAVVLVATPAGAVPTGQVATLTTYDIFEYKFKVAA